MRNNYRKYTLESCCKVAKERFGKCISNQITHKVIWQCHFDHVWSATPANVIANKSWCPTCKSFLSERICRLAFETIFGKPFIKSRPVWLKNKNNKQLELDGFCEELGIAFEHNGLQHYKNHAKFIMNLEKIQENDQQKIKLCAENKVKLIIIPQINYKVNFEELKKFIKTECLKKDIELPKNFDLIEINFNLVYQTPSDKDYLNEIKLKANSRGFLLLSTTYLGSSSKLSFKCKNCNYEFKISSSRLHKISCNNCAIANRRLSIDDAINLAKSKNGKCLSNIYLNNHSKLKWKCDNGHVWEASYNSIQRDWCPHCKRIKHALLQKSKIIPIEVYQEIAESKGGKCLSLTVASSHDKLEWQCREGHVWNAKAYSVKNRGDWCKICSIKNRKNNKNNLIIKG